MYTHKVLQRITERSALAGRVIHRWVEMYWGTHQQCVEYTGDNHGAFQIVEMTADDLKFYNLKY